MCTGFAFNPNKFSRTGLRILPINELRNFPTSSFPRLLQFSERVDQHFNADFFTDPEIKKRLGKYNMVAKIKMRFLWRVAATTNIKEFNGKLSNLLIAKILQLSFPH
jgi:hypothetical protein